MAPLVVVNEDSTNRVESGLIGFWTFQEAPIGGNTIPDRSGVSPPLDLTVENPGNVTQFASHLTLDAATMIWAQQATKINTAVKASNEFTFEVWCAPRDIGLYGPARLLSMSDPSDATGARNMMIGQGGNSPGSDGRISIRTRSTEAEGAGVPNWEDGAPYLFSSGDLMAPGELVHLVVTFTYNESSGGADRRIYRNSVLEANDFVYGTFGNWGDDFDFIIGDENDNADDPTRNWFGDLYLVAVYDRSLSEAEIEQNGFAGPLSDGTVPPTSVAFASDAYDLPENAGESLVEVVLSSARNYDVVVPITFGGDAVLQGAGPDPDYSSSAVSVTFLPGETTKFVTLTGINRAGDQGDRDAVLGFGTMDTSKVIPGTQDTTTVTIQEAEVAPTIGFSSAGSAVLEGQSRQVVVEMSNPFITDIDVEFSFPGGGTASPTDYTVQTASPVTIPAGSTSAAITIDAADDGAGDSGETVEITLDSATVGEIDDGADTHTLTILESAAVPLVEQGSGWSGSTPEPPAYGSGNGSTSRPCARWDVVPDQDFSDDFTIGVVAFHYNGIARVSFSADNGPWVDSTEMALNPRTGVWEYACTLDSAAFSDGATEIRAIVYPRDQATQGVPSTGNGSGGRPRVLTLRLHCNRGGSLPVDIRYVSTSGNDSSGTGSEGSPYRTIWRAASAIHSANGNASGGVVRLFPGTYQIDNTGGARPNTTGRWLTVEGREGQSHTQVTINGWSDRFAPHLHLKNLTLRTSTSSTAGYNVAVWGDSMEMHKSGVPTSSGDYNGQFFNWSGSAAYGDIYLTGVIEHDIASGNGGVTLRRDGDLYALGKDGIYNFKGLCVNTVVHDLAGVEGFHPDMNQMQGPQRDNIIMFNTRFYRCAGQGIFHKDPNGFPTNNSDWAYVNCVFDIYPSASPYGGPYKSQLKRSINHLLLWHLTWTGFSNASSALQMQTMIFDQADYPANGPVTFNDISFRNNVLASIGRVGGMETDDQIHEFFPAGSGSTNRTTGGTLESVFVDRLGTPYPDYHPQDGVLNGSGSGRAPMIVPCDANNDPRPGPLVSIGALE